MKKMIALLVLALLSLAVMADVAVPPETTGASATATESRAWPLVFLFVTGVALVILVAARRARKNTPPA